MSQSCAFTFVTQIKQMECCSLGQNINDSLLCQNLSQGNSRLNRGSHCARYGRPATVNITRIQIKNLFVSGEVNSFTSDSSHNVSLKPQKHFKLYLRMRIVSLLNVEVYLYFKRHPCGKKKEEVHQTQTSSKQFLIIKTSYAAQQIKT